MFFGGRGLEWTKQRWKCEKRKGLESFKYWITNKSKDGVFYKILLFFYKKNVVYFYSLLLLQSIITPQNMSSITRSKDIFLNHYYS